MILYSITLNMTFDIISFLLSFANPKLLSCKHHLVYYNSHTVNEDILCKTKRKRKEEYL